MGYPSEILPQPYYRRKLDVGELLNIYGDSLYIVRVAEGRPEDYQLGNPNAPYDERVLCTNIKSMSVNLLGGRYKTVHLPYLPNNDWRLDWDGNPVNVDCDKLEVGTDYRQFEECFGMYAHVRGLHNHVFPYPRIFGKDKDVDEYRKKMNEIMPKLPDGVKSEIITEFPVDENHKADLQGYLYFRHAPNRLNYWHWTLEIMTLDENEPLSSEKKTKKSLKNLIMELKLYYMQVFNVTIPDISEIDKAHYCV